jgi:mono/diheme cytochrome c family protein
VRRFAVIALALLLPLVVFGCGGGTDEDTAPETVEGQQMTQEEEEGGEAPAEGDPEAGREVFASAGCGNCHTFEAAGSSGTTAPNLDEAQPSFDDAVEQIRNGGGGMPAFEGDLSEEEITNVAAFVSGGG